VWLEMTPVKANGMSSGTEALTSKIDVGEICSATG